MKKKDLNRLSRKELVDIVYDMASQQDETAAGALPMEQISSERNRIARAEKRMDIFKKVLAVLMVASAVSVLLSTLLFPVIQVSGNSMEPTLSDGDILLTLKSKHYEQSELCCVSWQNKLLLKRVIALPGDVVNIDGEGTVYVNGKELDEPYVTSKSLGECDLVFPYEVPKDKFFILGDNRVNSIDSRSTVIGCVSEDQMVGRVLLRIWPLRK